MIVAECALTFIGNRKQDCNRAAPNDMHLLLSYSAEKCAHDKIKAVDILIQQKKRKVGRTLYDTF